MKTIRNAVNRAFLQIESWPEKVKYNVLVYGCAAVHTILIALFSYMGVLPMAIFNCFSVVIYFYCGNLLKREMFFITYLITYLEIILHSFVATIFVGWSYGFPLYILALVLISYYICYTMNADNRRLATATVMALFSFLAFVGCRILSALVPSSYRSGSEPFQIGVYIFNCVLCFSLLIGFSLVFLLEMRHLTRKLEELADIDPLTGLYNRRSMHKFLARSMERGVPFSLMMCDIDDFKKLNDTYGHELGDLVLREVSGIIREQLSEGDYVCRWGGEEILILCNVGNVEQLRRVAESIRCRIAEHDFDYQGMRIHCTLTMGLARHPSGQEIEATISAADQKLYQGKRGGKNRVVV